jgi:hypothetical protein
MKAAKKAKPNKRWEVTMILEDQEPRPPATRRGDIKSSLEEEARGMGLDVKKSTVK